MLLLTLLGAALAGTPGPTLYGLDPSSIYRFETDVLTLSGTSFGTNAVDASVSVGGSPCPILTITNTEITCTPPWHLNGDFGVTATVSSLPSNTLLLNMNLGQDFDSVEIRSGPSSYHTCFGVGLQGVLVCWGRGWNGQLGRDSQVSYGSTPGQLPLLRSDVGGPFSSFAVGGFHTCVVDDAAQVRCFGYNSNGQLGYGNTNDLGDAPGEMPPPVVELGENAAEVSAGYEFTCALLVSGNVKCWGDGSQGQLGYGNTDDLTQPSASYVTLDGTVVSISCGAYHTCALDAVGQVYCWGSSSVAQLGYGNLNSVGSGPNQMPPSFVDLAAPAISVHAGAYHTCVISDGGLSVCWGDGRTGALGNGANNIVGDATNDFPFPSVSSSSSVTSLGVGGAYDTAPFGSSCIVKLAGGLYCFGANTKGQLGLGSTTATNAPTSPVTLPTPPHSVAMGSSFTCTLLVDGELVCFGFNGEGQLGIGNTNDIGDSSGENPTILVAAPPTLLSMDPTTIDVPSTQITIFGVGFGSTLGDITISLDATACTPETVNPFYVTCTPAYTIGSYAAVTVTRTGRGVSNPIGPLDIIPSETRTRTMTHQTRTRTRTLTHQTRTRTKTKQTRTRTMTKQTRTRTMTKQTRTRTMTKQTRTRTMTKQTRTRTMTKQTRTRTMTKQTRTRTMTKQTRTRTKTKQTRTRTMTKQTRTRTMTKQTRTRTQSVVPAAASGGSSPTAAIAGGVAGGVVGVLVLGGALWKFIGKNDRAQPADSAIQLKHYEPGEV